MIIPLVPFAADVELVGTYRCSRKIDKTTWIRYSVRQIFSIFLEYQVRILTVCYRVDQKIPGGTSRKIDENCLCFCLGWYSVLVLKKIHVYVLLVTPPIT
jgi:hypothetical protein